MDTSELLKQAQSDLAFALAQGDGYAEDDAAERCDYLQRRADAIYAAERADDDAQGRA